MSKYHVVGALELEQFDELLQSEGPVQYLHAFNSKGEGHILVRRGLKVTESPIERELIDANKESARRTDRHPDKFTFLYVYKEGNPNGHTTGCTDNGAGVECSLRVSDFDRGERLKPVDPAVRRAIDEIVSRLVALLRRLG